MVQIQREKEKEKEKKGKRKGGGKISREILQQNSAALDEEGGPQAHNPRPPVQNTEGFIDFPVDRPRVPSSGRRIHRWQDGWMMDETETMEKKSDTFEKERVGHLPWNGQRNGMWM